ncbi:MAG: VacJ family lipoprotein [Gammaproteobacteria bacterium]|nr:VacJ family lipoprotein [Gammaproteobacteria bacterium]
MQTDNSSSTDLRTSRHLVWCVGLLIVAAGVLSGTARAEVEVDPWEGMNRKLYAVNDGADRAILKPIARGYQWLFPRFIRRGIHNIFRNIGTPSVAVNQLLQGKAKPAVSDTTRFVVNSTLGIGGIFDVATEVGLAEHEEDFGQTLAVWGVGNGPFFTIPFRGPATTTHAFGMLVEAFASPLQLISPTRDRYIAYGVMFVDMRSELLAAEALMAGDEYLFLRDAYLQRREYLIKDGEIEDDPFLDDFDDYEDDYDQ